MKATRRLGCWVLFALVLATLVVLPQIPVRREQLRELDLIRAIEDDERELARPVVRPVLRGEPVDAEVRAKLDVALAGLGDIAARRTQRPIVGRPPRWTRDTADDAKILAVEGAARAALQGGVCARNAPLPDLVSVGLLGEANLARGPSIRTLDRAFALLDEVRLRHDLARSALPGEFALLLSERWDPRRRLEPLLGHLAAASLEEIARELHVLATTLPSYADAVRRERLDRRRAFLDTITLGAPETGPSWLAGPGEVRRALVLADEWKAFEAEEAILATAEAEARLPLAEALALPTRTRLPPHGFLRRANPQTPPRAARMPIWNESPPLEELDVIADVVAPELARLEKLETDARARAEALRR